MPIVYSILQEAIFTEAYIKDEKDTFSDGVFFGYA